MLLRRNLRAALVVLAACHALAAAAANTPPSAVLTTGTVRTGLGPQSLPDVFRSVTAGEAGQTVSATCTAADASLLSVQPTLNILGSNSVLQYSAARYGHTRVTCTFSDNLLATRPYAFTLSIETGNQSGATPVPDPAGNHPPTATLYLPAVRTTSGAQKVRNVFVNVDAGDADQSVVATCVPADATLFTTPVLLEISSDGRSTSLTYTAGRYGSTRITCTFTDSVGGSTAYTFPVSIETGSAPVELVQNPGAKGMMRLALTVSVAAFRQAAFKELLAQMLDDLGLSPRVNWVCPQSACAVGAPCPVAGLCLIGAQVQTRAFSAQQASGVTYVDFDVLQTDGRLPLAWQKDEALRRISNDVNNCQRVGGCILSPMRPSHLAVTDATVSPVAVVATGDDDSLEGWEIALIVVGSVCCCCVVLAVVLWLACCRQKKPREHAAKSGSDVVDSKGEGGERAAATAQNTAGTTYETYDSYDRSETSVSTEQTPGGAPAHYPYANSAYPTPQPLSPAAASLQPGDRVRALYIDGFWYEAILFARHSDGTYEVEWAQDGTHSSNIPPDQVERIGVVAAAV